MQLPNHPYYGLDNILLTHYSAHASESANRELFDLFIVNLDRYRKNEDLLNIVSY